MIISTKSHFCTAKRYAGEAYQYLTLVACVLRGGTVSSPAAVAATGGIPDQNCIISKPSSIGSYIKVSTSLNNPGLSGCRGESCLIR